jgi:hypothetical protein
LLALPARRCASTPVAADLAAFAVDPKAAAGQGKRFQRRRGGHREPWPPCRAAGRRRGHALLARRSTRAVLVGSHVGKTTRQPQRFRRAGVSAGRVDASRLPDQAQDCATAY